MIPGNSNPLLAFRGQSYQVSRSLRFNALDSAYLFRAPTLVGNRKKWTWSGWVKVFDLSSTQVILSAGPPDTSANETGLISLFLNSGRLWVKSWHAIGAFTEITSTSFLRDVTAWYHIVVALDTDNATAADRIQLYANNNRLSVTGSYPSLGTQYSLNNTVAHGICRYVWNGAYPTDIQLAEINFVDGQALLPTSFGATDAYGEWRPIPYSGTYGTNGYKLNFSDNSAATAGTLGKDQAGTNNWTPVNLSVTAGAGNDSHVDTPTSYGTDTGVGGEVRGNYAGLNPLHTYLATTTNGGLDCTTITGWIGSTHHMSTGKWYAEFTVVSGTTQMFGVCTSAHNATTRPWQTAGTPGVTYYVSNGGIYVDGSFATSVGGAVANNIISVAIDVDTRSVVIRKNNVIITTRTIGVANSYMFYVSDGGTSSTATVNFGQRPFAYTAPSGYKALCDTNLDAGSITTNGTFTGNANANGPCVWLNGTPTAMTINGNAVTFGTHADKLASGFKLRTANLTHNASGNNTYSVTTTGNPFKYARAQLNP